MQSARASIQSLHRSPKRVPSPSSTPASSTPSPSGAWAWAWGGTGRAETCRPGPSQVQHGAGQEGRDQDSDGQADTSPETVGFPAHSALGDDELNPVTEGEAADSLH